MQQDNRDGSNVEHAHNAEENRDALEAQARRTEATTPPEVRTESRPAGAGDAPVPAGEGSEDATRAAAHARQAEENRDALEEQARRTEATTPPELR